nr:hypothetical protein [Tanacetum cinerariifolium]
MLFFMWVLQFWSSVSVKKVNDVVRLQALIDRKKVILTEATVREALRLDDAGSIDCLPNEEIFTELSRMGYKKPSTKLTFYKAFFLAQLKFLIHTILQCMSVESTSWNEFSSSMASAVICLSTVANDVDVDDVPAVDVEPTPPSPPPTTPPPPQELHSTSQVIHTLPPTLIAQPSSPPQQQQPSQPTTISMDLLNNLLETYTALTRRIEDLKQDKIAQFLEIIKLKQKVRRMHPAKEVEVEKDADVQGRLEESQAQIYKIDLEHADEVLSIRDDVKEPAELQKVIEVVTTTKLMTEVVTAATTTNTVDAPITAATITVVPTAARRRKGVVIRDPEKTDTPSTIVHLESKSKGKGILVKEKGKQDNVVLRYQALKRKPRTEAQARKNMMIYLKNMAGSKMDYFKAMSYDDTRLIFEKHFNSNMDFLDKSKEQLEEKPSRALMRTSESQEEKAAKKQKLDEDVKELKKHLQIIPSNEDDVYIEVTPLAHKFLVVDYEIYTENNKPYYKIMRADGSHQLFLRFLSLLRNFDIEDLEMILLAERRYLLTRFTLEQMMNNVRLEVKEESEVSLELLRFTSKIYSKGLRLLVKTYCCWCKLVLLDDVVDIKLKLLEQSFVVDEKMKKYD